MIELRSNICVTSINVDKCKWNEHPIKPRDSPTGSRGKTQHMLYTRGIGSFRWLRGRCIGKSQVCKWGEQSKS